MQVTCNQSSISLQYKNGYPTFNANRAKIFPIIHFLVKNRSVPKDFFAVCRLCCYAMPWTAVVGRDRPLIGPKTDLVMDDRMKITVKLFAVLQVERFREKELDYPAGTKVGDVVNDLDLPAEHVDILLVNGSHVDRESLLQDGDILSLLPMVEGG